MASDLQRAEPSSEASDRISPSEADLVAYWTFEEGSGYLVKDVTANKHDLHIQQPPHWRVSCLRMHETLQLCCPTMPFTLESDNL